MLRSTLPVFASLWMSCISSDDSFLRPRYWRRKVRNQLFQDSVPMAVNTFRCSTFHVRQAMRDYLGSDERLSTTDRTYLLRLKNARSASRCFLIFIRLYFRSCSRLFFSLFRRGATLSVGPSQQRSFQPRCTFRADFVMLHLNVFVFFPHFPVILSFIVNFPGLHQFLR